MPKKNENMSTQKFVNDVYNSIISINKTTRTKNPLNCGNNSNVYKWANGETNIVFSCNVWHIIKPKI